MVTTSTQWWEIGIFTMTQEGLDRPDLMFHYGSVPFDMNLVRRGYPTTENAFCLTPNVTHARSRGTVRLRTRDFRDKPKVDPRYFTDPHDERVMIYGVRLAREIVSQSAMDDWRGRRARAGAGCAVGRRAARLHPQDAQHRLPPVLHGPDGRAPTTPTPRSTLACGSRACAGCASATGRSCRSSSPPNPVITTMMIGEKCADMVKEDAGKLAEAAAS